MSELHAQKKTNQMPDNTILTVEIVNSAKMFGIYNQFNIQTYAILPLSKCQLVLYFATLNMVVCR